MLRRPDLLGDGGNGCVLLGGQRELHLNGRRQFGDVLPNLPARLGDDLSNAEWCAGGGALLCGECQSRAWRLPGRGDQSRVLLRKL
jgi:hypothetical protein